MNIMPLDYKSEAIKFKTSTNTIGIEVKPTLKV